MKTLHWTSSDLELLPDDEGKRYEIVDGELHVSKQPSWQHQLVCLRIAALLEAWCDRTEEGEANFAPGLIFADDNDIVPDVVWISNERLAFALEADGKLHAAPELVIEVLSPGSANAKRDRQLKLNLYSRREAQEYWIVDWQTRQVEVYRRKGNALTLYAILHEGDSIQSLLIPEFECKVSRLFTRVTR